MRQIGIFEAKTKLSEICERVAETAEPVMITRRGKPFVVIDPLPGPRESVWDLRDKHCKEDGPFEEDIALPIRSEDLPNFTMDP